MAGSEQQGLQEQIERFRNCPVMHPEVPQPAGPSSAPIVPRGGLFLFKFPSETREMFLTEK